MEFLERLATEAAVSKSKLADQLIEVVENLRVNNTYTHDEIKKQNINGIIFKHTKILTDFMIKKNVGINAYVNFPQMDKNHPFFTNYDWYGSRSDVTITALNLTGKVKGTVDPTTMSVGGIYSKVKIDLVVGYELIKNKGFTPQEVVAIILHELGHIYTYFLNFGELTKRNFMISNVLKNLQGGNTYEQKEDSLVEAERVLGIKLDKKNEIINLNGNSEQISSILISNDVVRAGSSSRTPFYDVRTVEQIADKFAIEHGAGVELATALNKIYRTYWVKETRSPAMFVAIELSKFIIWLILTFSMPVTMILYTLSMLPGPKVYDSPESRIRIIKQQLVTSVKDLKDEPLMRNKLIEQIKTVEEIEKQLKDRRTILEVLYNTFTPRGRSMYEQEVFMKNIESLIYNDTYLSAAKFGAIKDE